jgi:FemAB-related protein (PEP-CTERM system-associated)
VALRVETFTDASERWDGFVRATPGWSHYHLHGWRRVIESALGHECPYLAALDSERGELRGVLPLVRVRSALFGHYLVSMPFLNYGGPLGDEPAVKALVGEAVARAAARRVGLLELRNRDALPVDLPVSHRKITVLLDLPAGDATPLWDGLAAKVRSQVRRPIKEGLTVRFGPDQVGPFYQVFAHHMRDLGTPVLSRGLFDRILEIFPDDVWFGCAWLGDRPVAGGCGFRWAGEFEMTWASSLRAYSKIAPNMLLYWRFIERCVAEGVSTFNFGRCTPGSGTHRFKAQWGARDVPLHWYQRSADGAAGTPSPDDSKYRLATKVWSHLPLAVANRLGPHLVRLIP